VLIRLILLLFPLMSFSRELPPHEELSQFAKSIGYKNLFYMDKESTAYHDQFFMAGAEGRRSLDLELKTSLSIFTQDIEKRCHFPARFTLINNKWPHLFEGGLEHCEDLNGWMKDLPVDEVSLVFSGAYINNPASMFGHVFLNLNHSSQPKLLGYSLSYEANIDQSDMAVFYMLKGLFGGYLGFFNLKPYYENVGAYNNAESRELWEYPLKLSETEIKFLKYHLWEVIHHSGFKYFFTHKNCASYLARFLMAVRPELELSMSNAVLAFPHKMLKEGLIQIGAEPPRYRSSLKDRILSQYENLSGEERKVFFMAKKDQSTISEQLPRRVLELLVDELKFINYKKQAELAEEERNLFDKSLSSLAKNSEPLPKELALESKYFPHESHEAKKASLIYREDRETAISFRLGEHSYEDSIKGYNKSSFVEFGKLEFLLKASEKKVNLSEAKFIEILSLNPFSILFPSPSWSAGFSYKETCSLCKRSENKIWSLYGALGLSQLVLKDKVQASLFTGLHALSYKDYDVGHSHQQARAFSEFLIKFYLSESVFYLSKLQKTWSIERHLVSSHTLNFASSQNSQLGLGLEFSKEQNLDNSKANIFIDFYL
jgi:hypothetical protein